MICNPCCDGNHESCRGDAQCPCQHKTSATTARLLDVLDTAAADIRAGRPTVAER